MIIDSQLLFSDAQALTAAAASTNLVDLGAIRDIGTGEPLYVFLSVDVALTDSGSNSTVTVDAQTDDAAAFGSATTAQTLFTIAATAAAGTMYLACLGPTLINERFLRLYYTMNNGNLDTGTVTAALVKNVQRYVSYANNFTIS